MYLIKLLHFYVEPPRHLWVVHENGTQVAKASVGVNTSQNVGPYYVGDTVHLACVAYGGKAVTYSLFVQV